MKKFFVLFILPLFSFTILSDWETLQIDSRASIEFPLKPNMDKEDSWSVDFDHVRYLMKITDLSKRGLDSAALASIVKQPEMLDLFSKGFLVDEGSSIIDKKISTLHGYTVFEYVFNPGKNSQFKKLYAKLIFVGAKTYAPAVFVNDEKASQDNRQKFFNSFKLN